MSKHFAKHGWGVFFSLAAIEGILLCHWLLTLSADAENSFLFGLSSRRLVLAGVMGIGILTFGWLALKSWRSAVWRDRWLSPLRRRRLFLGLWLSMPLVFALCLLILLTLQSLYLGSGEYFYRAYAERSTPLLIWGCILSLQTIVWLPFAGLDLDWTSLRRDRPAFIVAGFFWVAAIAAGIFMHLSGAGFLPDGFRLPMENPAVAFLEWQLWLPLLLGGMAGAISCYLARTRASSFAAGAQHLITLAGFFFFWVIAALIWSAAPMPEANYAPPGRLPNNEIYPFSDAAEYDLYTQNLLVGNGYIANPIPPRPLYLMFLTAAHLLVGQDYLAVIQLQTIVMALLPAALFLLGSLLYSRSGGIAIGALAIFRELAVIQATPFADNISNTKLLLSELPTTLGIVLFALFLSRWLKDPRRQRIDPFLAGGFLGCTLLIRFQSIVLLGVAVVVAFLALRREQKHLWRGLAWFTLGILLVIAPWLWRNYRLSGQITIDDPRQAASVAYSVVRPETNPRQRLPGESDQDHQLRVIGNAVTSLTVYPLQIAEYSIAHWLRCEANDLAILPVRTDLQNMDELLRHVRPFWQSLYAQLTPPQAGLFILNLLFIAIGVGYCWKNNGWVGLLPLLINFAYNLTLAFSHRSGGRYLMPVDWVIYFYFAIGCFQVVRWILQLCGQIRQDPASPENLAHPQPSGNDSHPRLSKIGFIFCGLFFLAIGMTLPLSEIVFPQKYPSQTKESLLAQVLEEDTQLSQAERDNLNTLISNEKIIVGYGPALYPRFYDVGEEESRTGKTGYTAGDTPRMVFYLLDRPNRFVILNLSQPPVSFPNATEAILIGCRAEKFTQGILVYLPQEKSTLTAPGGIPRACE